MGLTCNSDSRSKWTESRRNQKNKQAMNANVVNVFDVVNGQQPNKKTVRIVAMSDTHKLHLQIAPTSIPPGEIFLHCGDFANRFLFRFEFPWYYEVV
jgi:UDP-2,3-diacylglucosamine pyrophosphatase LpxH